MSIDKTKLDNEFIIPEGEQEIYDFIGKTIRDARVARNISQQEIADIYKSIGQEHWLPNNPNSEDEKSL